ncbi:LysR family transcriptional regulator [Kocuria rhizophila]|uniref:LysR family transcriptional regulator n=1 Tax=Kocuria TaxID=57493 RepID=UPI0009E4B3EE|nr:MULTISPECIES: LysR family transcriptional regulator [Kocuria]MDN3226041.1 LysR family transcriptional regulator [Kocuria rhizophila]PKZ37914.1 LysR family transcriptional regulator [Kocuria rhizophila]
MRRERPGNLLRWVEDFLVVVETGHVGRAAEALGVSQPPLSQTIRKLETAVGEELFVRHARGVSLTPAGEAFLPLAHDLVSAQRRALTLGNDIAERASAVRVWVPRSLPAAWISACLLDNVDTFPQAEWAGASSADIVRHVRENTAAVGMVVAPIVTDELVSLPVVAIPQVLCMRPLPAAPIHRNDLRHAVPSEMLVPPRTDGPAAFDVLSADLEALGVITQLRQEVDPLKIAAEMRTLGAATLMPSDTPGFDGAPLEAGLLPLRLRVIHHPDAAPQARDAAMVLHDGLGRCAAHVR